MGKRIPATLSLWGLTGIAATGRPGDRGESGGNAERHDEDPARAGLGKAKKEPSGSQYKKSQSDERADYFKAELRPTTLESMYLLSAVNEYPRPPQADLLERLVSDASRAQKMADLTGPVK